MADHMGHGKNAAGGWGGPPTDSGEAATTPEAADGAGIGGAEPVVASDAPPAGPPAGERGTEPKYELRSKKLIAILGVCTAVLTFATTALGVVSVRFEQERDQAEDRASALTDEVDALSVQATELESDRDDLQQEIADLERERNRLQDELDTVRSPDDGPDSNPLPTGVTYLSDERRLDSSYFDDGIAQVSGETYLNSVWGRRGGSICPDVRETFADYNLGRGYEVFRATAGLSDENESADHRVVFEVIVDNEVLYEESFVAGEAKAIEISVDGGLRLRLQNTFHTGENCGNGGDKAVWGDAALVPASAES